MGSIFSIGFDGKNVAASRHCEERSDEAIHTYENKSIGRHVDCFGRASLAMTATASFENKPKSR